jgi:hypothetical protein
MTPWNPCTAGGGRSNCELLKQASDIANESGKHGCFRSDGPHDRSAGPPRNHGATRRPLLVKNFARSFLRRFLPHEHFDPGPGPPSCTPAPQPSVWSPTTTTPETNDHKGTKTGPRTEPSTTVCHLRYSGPCAAEPAGHLERSLVQRRRHSTMGQIGDSFVEYKRLNSKRSSNQCWKES